MPNLTDTLIRAAKPPERGQVTLTDTTLQNFGIRLSQGGSKTFVVMLGNGRRKTIGRYPLISLADARREARRILAEKTLGKVHPARTPFAEAADAFLIDCRTRTRPRTLKDYTRLLKHFPFGRTALADIKPRDILTQLKPLPPSEKHHAFTAARVFFRWCIHQHFIDRSPMENLDVPNNGRSRERVLSSEELACLWGATGASPSVFCSIVRLLILLGLRRSEAASLRFEWFNDEERLLTIPSTHTKNARALVIPYGDLTQQVLDSIPRVEGRPYLFPAARQRSETTTVMNGWGKPKAALDKQLNIAPWTLHDIRRSYASFMQQLGVRVEVTERLLGHISGTQAGIVGVYQRYHWLPEMREAVGKWERYLTELVSPVTAPC